jgi:hypothetical protein
MSLQPAPFLFLRAVLAKDWLFLLMTLAACAIAAVVAMFQYSVYTSFLRSSAVVVTTLGGDFWVTSAIVGCFDFRTISTRIIPLPWHAMCPARHEAGLSSFAEAVGFPSRIWRDPTGSIVLCEMTDTG